ncbi:phosphotransferase [Bacillus sp. FJAT-49732]|uniref:Phosphotransferase n=1 Tax=Lederbergia citrisecunda TaxID=2833583 RepID=A0A942TIH0_9BACI|nr:phosphotransferase [Lederbergia citrisecunda]MBS4198173.1 phosphotransferase [Lederbergia citrisecunda]
MLNLRTMLKGLSDDVIAKNLIQNWDHDKGSLQFWRASSNFVYAFTQKQERFFLRFTLEKEKPFDEIMAELDFIQYLKSHDFPSVHPIPSLNGRLIETKEYPEGRYFAVVFSSASGILLDDDINEEQCEEWGRSLAKLHSLSRLYNPIGVKRKSWRDMLNMIEDVIQTYPDEHEAKVELENLTLWLENLPTSPETFGLIHYDFQLDNIFYKKSRHSFEVIDFDDSMYHWFAMDIVMALADLYENDNFPLINSFIKGYTSVIHLEDEVFSHFLNFQRLGKLYRFARIKRSLKNSEMADAPSWYEPLRAKLISILDNARSEFHKEG